MENQNIKEKLIQEIDKYSSIKTKRTIYFENITFFIQNNLCTFDLCSLHTIGKPHNTSKLTMIFIKNINYTPKQLEYSSNKNTFHNIKLLDLQYIKEKLKHNES